MWGSRSRRAIGDGEPGAEVGEGRCVDELDVWSDGEDMEGW